MIVRRMGAEVQRGSKEWMFTKLAKDVGHEDRNRWD